MPQPLMTYSFLDVQASINGPGGSFSLGSGAGAAEEGISVEQADDLGTLTIGADGAGMHSLHANKSGKVTVRLLKTSLVNAQLSAMAALQRTSGSVYGQNTLTVVNTVTGDLITCQQAAFARIPTISYGKDAGTIEWEFNVAIIDVGLGAGVA